MRYLLRLLCVMGPRFTAPGGALKSSTMGKLAKAEKEAAHKDAYAD
jgi:hypothetical protein